jgi:hypothetical protein
MILYLQKLFTLALIVVLASCASGHCRKTTVPMKPTGPTTSNTPQPTQEGTEWIYKYDGSLQCSQGNETSLEQAAQQLEGIPILAQEKRTDTLMRVQVCGQPTGRANAFKIHLKDLPRALELGFKVWDFE